MHQALEIIGLVTVCSFAILFVFGFTAEMVSKQRKKHQRREWAKKFWDDCKKGEE